MKSFDAILGAIIAATVLTACGGGASDTRSASSAGVWHTVANLQMARFAHTATLLRNGKILVVGGSTTNSTTSGVLADAELYDSETNAWTSTGALATARSGHTATLLPNGKVLVVGGTDGSKIFTDAELFDPATNAWTAAGRTGHPRTGHTATLLSDGRVLVVGGRGCFFPICGSFPSAELYDPATNAWTFTGTLADARAGHTATLLQNGMVIVAGGGNGSHFFATSELYDPATSVWTAAGSLASVRSGHTATILPNGRVLIAAGSSPPIGKSNLIPSATAELYDPASNTWKVAGSLTTARIAHAMTLMSNGQVLVVGGYNGDQILASAEVYEPATDVWTATGALAVARVAHTATLLLNGKVLVAGGDNYGGIGAVTYSSAELYNLAINP